MIQKAGFDLIWFGIFIVLLVEIAEVTPPVGFNLFVLQNMTGKDSNTIARAAIPFFVCLVVCIAADHRLPADRDFRPGCGDGRLALRSDPPPRRPDLRAIRPVIRGLPRPRSSGRSRGLTGLHAPFGWAEPSRPPEEFDPWPTCSPP